MSEEILLVKDLPEEEKNVILESFKKLCLSGIPLKMEVNAARGLIAAKQKENGVILNEVTTINENNDSLITQKFEESVKPTVAISDRTDKKSDGRCIICHSPVYDGICSVCKTKFRG